jgi:hypothetical protein
VAEKQRCWAEAEDYFLKELEISVELDHQPGTATALRSLARLWQASGDDDLPAAVAIRLGVNPEEAAEKLRSFEGD